MMIIRIITMTIIIIIMIVMMMMMIITITNSSNIDFTAVNLHTAEYQLSQTFSATETVHLPLNLRS